MKHVWKSKEKTDADVEEGLRENENIKQEYVIQVVRKTKYKWWFVIAIYMLVMFLFGLSYYMLRTYSFSETMSVICQKYLPMSESQFESQKSSPSKEALETSTESLIVDKLKLLENENDFPPYSEALAKSIAQSPSEMESDNTVQKVFDPLLLSLDDLKRLNENSMFESQFESQKLSPSNEAFETSTESLTIDKLKLLENENDFPPFIEVLAKSIAQSSSEIESDNTVRKVFDPLESSLLDDSEMQRLKENSMEDLISVFKLFSEFENDSNKDELFPLSNVAKIADADEHSLTKNDKLKLLENENDFPPYMKVLAKSIAQSSSEMKSDTVRKVFDPLLLPLWNDLKIQRLKENSMEDLISVLFPEFKNDSNKDELSNVAKLTKIADEHNWTKNEHMMPEDLVSKLFSEFKNDSNEDELFPLLNVNKIADADTHSSTKSDNMMPADDVKNLKTVPSSEDLKVDETHDEKSSVESGVVNCPPDKFDEFSTEVSSSESAQLEEEDIDHQIKWLYGVPFMDSSFMLMPYFWNSEEQDSQLARDSVKDIKQIARNIKHLYGSRCTIIFREGVVDIRFCLGLWELSEKWENMMMSYWNSEDFQAFQLEHIRDSVKDINQIVRNIQLLYGGRSCKIIITKGVVDTTSCPGFSEYDAESNLESSASPQTTTTLFSTQTNTILPSIQTSTMLPSTQTTTTTTHITTEEDNNDDYNYDEYNNYDDYNNYY